MNNKKRNGKNIKIFVVAGIMAISVGAIIKRLTSLHVWPYKDFVSISDKQYSRMISINRERGIIYDKNMQPMAMNVKSDSIFANPKEVKDIKNTVTVLSNILKIKKSALLKRLGNSKNFIWIKRKVKPEQAYAITKANLEGVGVIKENDRTYPEDSLASSIIGFVGIDNQGLAGLEYKFNEYIEGAKNIVMIEKDGKGRDIKYAEKWLNQDKGCDIHTTIDKVIQYSVERELKKQVEEFGAKGGVVIVMQPSSGDILAIANYPRFNPNNPDKYQRSDSTNKGVSHSYEPGSTFKTILAAAAIEEKAVTPDDIFYCGEGFINIGGITIHDSEKHDNAWLTTKQIIADSSNVGAVNIAKRLKKELFYKYIEKFGFGRKTNIELPGEADGLIAPLKRWSDSSLGAISIGHEVSVTPIQLIAAVSAIANGGSYVKPRVVTHISKGEKIIKEFPHDVGERVISESTAKIVTDMLEKVVTDGTGKLASTDGYTVAGKTGTAKKIDSNTGTYSNDKYLASFIGYLPSKNPEIAILVMIDEPKSEIYGGTVSAPLFKRIAEQIVRILRIAPEKGLNYAA